MPWALGLALVMLAIMYVSRTLGLRDELRGDVVAEMRADLQERVAEWENGLLDDLGDMLDLSTVSNDPEALQADLGMRKAWFERLYQWNLKFVDPVTRRRAGIADLTFPLPPPAEDLLGVSRHPCMNSARLMRSAQFAARKALTTPLHLASLYGEGCRKAPISARLYAAGEAASWLESFGDLEGALEALDGADVDPDLTVGQATELGIAPVRLVARRLQRAKYLAQLGRESEAADFLFRTGREIGELDAPALDTVRRAYGNLIHELQFLDRRNEAMSLRIELGRLDRRIRAWREVNERIVQGKGYTPYATHAPAFAYDQYADTPFILYYGSGPTAGRGAALQLDQSLLLGDFMQEMGRFASDISVVTDATRAVVAGSQPPENLEVSVDFSRTLTHLRVGMSSEAIDRRLADLSNQWIVPLVFVVFLLIVGMITILFMTRAERKLEELLARQREFTTRITHELKTPLAGIRLMGELLETGSFRDDTEREEMSRRIVDEADRLKGRIEEVLRAAKETRLPEPVRFDPEEIVLEAIDQWGPRLEQAGVAFQADLAVAPEVKGDPAAVRDAIGCLLDNALKYRDPSKPVSHVWLNLRGDDAHAIVEVIDNGLGVPPRMRGKIFGRFVRVEGPNRGRSGGHGLGLAQVARVAHDHGGKVACTEGVDGGARFVLELHAA